MTRRATRGAFEDDVFHARRIFCYTQRAGACRAAKRQANRRERREGRREARDTRE